MPVIDSNRPDYDFYMQTVNTACKYDVVWLGTKLLLDVKDVSRSIPILNAYIQRAVEPTERHLRLMRVSVWLSVATRYVTSLTDSEFLADTQFDVYCEYHQMTRDLYPKRSFEKLCTWDWNVVRQDLRKLFAAESTKFLDIRRGLTTTSPKHWVEEKKYFIYLCDEDTYVR